MQNPAGSPSVPRSFRVLVVDDTRAIRVMLARLLRKMGHEVEEACDGQQGLEKVASFAPEVIFSDISMPVMNGLEMAKVLRDTDRLKGIQLVALTGGGQEADREQAVECGFHQLMVKPISAITLGTYFSQVTNR